MSCSCCLSSCYWPRFIRECVFFCSFFFFKQKTAYEMRTSDWSSDVCSSDHPAPLAEHLALGGAALDRFGPADRLDEHRVLDAHVGLIIERGLHHAPLEEKARDAHHRDDRQDRKSTRLNSRHYCASRMPSSS